MAQHQTVSLGGQVSLTFLTLGHVAGFQRSVSVGFEPWNLGSASPRLSGSGHPIPVIRCLAQAVCRVHQATLQVPYVPKCGCQQVIGVVLVQGQRRFLLGQAEKKKGGPIQGPPYSIPIAA